VTADVTYRHPSPIGGEAGQELLKALAVFYAEPSLALDGDETVVSITGATELRPAELGAIVRHFLRGWREQPQVELRRVAARETLLNAESVDDRRIIAPGAYIAGPRWTNAKALLRQKIIDTLPARANAPFLTVPSQIPEDVLLRAGYFEKFPHLVSPIAHLRPDYWDQVSVAALRRNQDSARQSFYVNSGTVLNPVTCYHVYANAHALNKDNVSSNGSYAIEGSVFRHEGRSLGPTRLSEFTMFELVNLGTESVVEMKANEFRVFFEDFFNGLGVPYRTVSASDAFFGDEPSLRRTSQIQSRSKYEIRIPLADQELSVASVNMHSDAFVDPFNLGDLGVEATCCAGIGVDRLLFALSAHGLATP